MRSSRPTACPRCGFDNPPKAPACSRCEKRLGFRFALRPAFLKRGLTTVFLIAVLIGAFKVARTRAADRLDYARLARTIREGTSREDVFALMGSASECRQVGNGEDAPENCQWSNATSTAEVQFQRDRTRSVGYSHALPDGRWPMIRYATRLAAR